MDIEVMNRQIIACRMLEHEIAQQYNTTQPVVHMRMLDSVREHRRYYGVIPLYQLKRQWVKIRRFIKKT